MHFLITPNFWTVVCFFFLLFFYYCNHCIDDNYYPIIFPFVVNSDWWKDWTELCILEPFRWWENQTPASQSTYIQPQHAPVPLEVLYEHTWSDISDLSWLHKFIHFSDVLSRYLVNHHRCVTVNVCGPWIISTVSIWWSTFRRKVTGRTSWGLLV